MLGILLLISLQKQKQFRRLSRAVKNLFDLVKQDWANRYINRAIVVAKRILLLLYNFFDYLQSPPPSIKAKIIMDNLGIEMVNNRYSKIIKKGSKIPIEDSNVYHTVEDYQKSIKSKIRFGSNSNATQNELIGIIEISGIPPLPAGEAKITVHFKIDKFGLLIAKQICHQTDKIEQREFDINEYLEFEDE